MPVFARRKRSVFKGPMNSSPHGRGGNPSGSRSASVQGRPSAEMMPGLTEEDEEEDEEDMEEYEDIDQFGPELNLNTTDLPSDDGGLGVDAEPVSPLSPLPGQDDSPLATAGARAVTGTAGVPLTAEALAKLDLEGEKKEAEELEKENQKAPVV